MFLSSGGTSVATPVNSGLMAQDDSKVFLQAHLGNNLSAATLVSGNANVVADTRGTGNWKFYVAGGNSIASITGASNSTEWTSGNLLSYDPGSPIILNYSFDTTTQSGNTIKNLATNDYGLTLMNGATIATASPAPYSTENAGYLSMNVSSGQYATSSVPLSFTNPWTISFWHKFTGTHNGDPTIFEIGNTNGFGLRISSGDYWKEIQSYKNGTQFDGYYYANEKNANWNHYALVFSDTGYTGYYNATTGSSFGGFPVLNVASDFTYMNFGKSNMSSVTNPNTGTWTIQIDKFQIFNTRLSLSDITAIYNGTYISPINATLKDTVTGVAWKPVPGSVVDASETNYTVKSNEIALRPGTNSTFAVWTATKFTNLKIDVSFADYHTRSAGVGFQMFKIKSDNTFDSVLFPRTVTTTALTNANSSNSSNYLPVPTVLTSVSAGDKIYLRVDANGNTTAASSVLATTIFTDAVSITNNPVENRALQANLAANLNSAILVSGNSNTVLDTAGTSNWKFYVAGNTSVASITGASNSTEWTSGNLLTYVGASASPPPTDYSLYYTFNTNKVSGTTITDSVSNATGTLVGATITTTSPSPAPGTGYLSIVNTFSPSPVTTNHASLTSITFPTGGMTLSFWIKPRTANAAHIISLNTGASNNIIFVNGLNNLTGIVVKGGAIGTYSNASPTGNLNIIGIWNHIVWTLSPATIYQFYVNGVLTNTHSGATHYYPNNVTTTASYIGRSIYPDAYYDGDFDDFRIYNRILTSDEAYSVFMAGAQSKFNDVTTGVTWMPTPAVPVNSSETDYTVKSNEIALTPGTNSTFAVWTAPKSTNIRVDVSFADYHSRNVGVGFQMFKINADNTFGSTIFPRTVTSTALTNAAPNNYLSVPSRSMSVATGDKIYLRIDANGNAVAASSVLSTNIYVDPNPDLKQPNLLQAHLGNNMAATTFVSGNANVVADTRGTGNWKFYVANGNSIASITGASNSTEWTSGSLLTYSGVEYSVFYPFNTNTVSGSTVLNMANNAYDLTLYNGASIINTTPFPATQPPATGSGYLNMNLVVTPAQYAQPTQPYSFNPLGSTISFWVRWTSNVEAAPVFSYGTGTNFFVITVSNFGSITWSIRNGASQSSGYVAFQHGGFPFNYVHITLATGTGAIYINGVFATFETYQSATMPTYGASIQPTWFYFGNYDPAISDIPGITRNFIDKSGTIGIDNFVVYNKTLTATEVMSLYAKSDLHYPLNVADINPGNPLQVGDVSTGPYVYNGTLVNGATIAVDSGSRIAGQGYLKLVAISPISSSPYASIPAFTTGTNGLTFAFWFRSNATADHGRIIDFGNGPDSNNIFIRIVSGNIGFAVLGVGTGTGVYVDVISSINDNVWRHLVWTLTNSVWTFYLNGTLTATRTNSSYPNNISRTLNYIGKSNWSSDPNLNGGIDDFRFYNRVIAATEISNLYSGTPQITLKDDATGVAWKPIPGSVLDDTETSYTIKNNEVALRPGTNSTFAVWTATKTSNLKIDVSFADYHTRSAGVGFQMFKIKSDNTFDSVLFPRTVTTAALTNAAPNNYLPVPTVSTSVSAGDKIYLRVDANGNTIAASSVLATTIFTDTVSVTSNLAENRLLQAHLGNNLNATTFVSGNANVVNDTAGTSNWKFYVAGNTSVAAITSSSASTEWTGGTVLSANDAFAGTLLFGATYVADAGSRVPGKNYLKLVNSTITPAQCASISPFTPTTNGISFSFWIRHTAILNNNTVFFFNFRDANNVNQTCMGNFWFGYPNDLSVANNTGSLVSTGIPFTSVANGNWHHIAWTMTYSASTTSTWKFYLDGVVGTPLTDRSYMNLVTRIYHNIGNYGDQGDLSYAVNGGVDNFRVHQKVLSDAEVLADIADNSNLPTQLSDSMSQSPVWKLKPAIAVNSSETNYTIKSNEIAIAPGANSTYVVWTAPKTTNVKVDVSFADYHSRNVGVGFQMFKINADNTFGSVIFPRTITSTALTNAAPNNYLSVPSRTISVATGDKIYYRVDANGNPTSASSVLATTIYVDPNPDFKQYNVLQANLGNNLSAATLVSGNSNVVADTRGTGNWKFYAAGGNSIASITGASNSSEWTGGSLLTYSADDYSVFYPFNTNTVSGSTVLNASTNAYDLTLYGGASIINTVPSPATQPLATGSGYLSMNTGTGQYAQATQLFSLNPAGSTISLWFRWTSNVSNAPIFSYDDGTSYVILYMWGEDWCVIYFKVGGVSNGWYSFRRSDQGITIGNWVHLTFLTATGQSFVNGVLSLQPSGPGPTAFTQPTKFYLGNSSASPSFLMDGKDFVTRTGTISVDNFVIYNKTLTETEIMTLYSKPDLYYPMDVADINPGNPLQVGDVSTGPYVYNGTLVNGATIVADAGSRVAGKGYLSLSSTSTQYVNLTSSISTGANGLSFAFWYRLNATLNHQRFFSFCNSGYTQEIMMGVSEGASFFLVCTNTNYTGMTSSPIYNNNTWNHVVWTITPTSGTATWKIYLNGVLTETKTSQQYPGVLSNRTYNWIGRGVYTGSGDANYNGGIDDFRFYNRAITAAEISYLYSGPLQPTLKDDATGVTWMPSPATPVNSSETSYTIKNNEVALRPGTNSTFAVWTATKLSNLKIDVSFADYHTRSAGVGFQMFKIKSDNTFDSVLFPRTVTTTALTNAAPNNYLPVPSVSTTVSAGDKIYLRVDANGNTIAASSVLATTIFTDTVSVTTNQAENRLLQAHLGNNLNATTFVSGNANVVNDTLGTSNWQFYVAGNTSVAAITSSSASTEWTGGTVLSANDAFAGTLLFGATYVADAGSRVPGKNYLKLVNSTITPAQCASISPFTPTTNGISFSFWIRHTAIDANNGAFFFNFRDANNVNQTFIGGSFYFGAPGFLSVSNNSGNPESTGIPFSSVANGNWHHIAWTMTYSASTTSTWKFYLDGVVSAGTTLTSKSYMNLVTRTYHNIGNYGDQGDLSYAINGGVDNFRVYQKVLSDAEVLADIADNSNLPTQLSDSMSQSPVWKLKPAIAVNSSETLYTIKSNEIALTPGTNSTYAVWTAPKSTNIRVDVSFADYHSRTAGIGFQMFKINNDNTFGSTIFPRTVTSTALTNAAPTNYLNVPSVSLSVSTGDKIYYRIDANGNTTSASSVIATNIYAYSGSWS